MKRYGVCPENIFLIPAKFKEFKAPVLLTRGSVVILVLFCVVLQIQVIGYCGVVMLLGYRVCLICDPVFCVRVQSVKQCEVIISWSTELVRA